MLWLFKYLKGYISGSNHLRYNEERWTKLLAKLLGSELMSKWSNLYEKEILSASSIDDYIKQKLSTKKRIIKLINKYAANNKIIELGAGTGVLALYISSLNNNSVDALDKDYDMISLSKKYFFPKFKNSNISYLCDDIRNINAIEKYDVCYSIGILEHYNDSEIINLINKQTAISEYVIFGIPTKYFDENKKMYGNERYLPLHYWRKLIKKSNCKIIEESSYHYLNFLKRIINYRKWFKPTPVHIFVIKKSC